MALCFVINLSHKRIVSLDNFRYHDKTGYNQEGEAVYSQSK